MDPSDPPSESVPLIDPVSSVRFGKQTALGVSAAILWITVQFHHLRSELGAMPTVIKKLIKSRTSASNSNLFTSAAGFRYLSHHFSCFIQYPGVRAIAFRLRTRQTNDTNSTCVVNLPEEHHNGMLQSVRMWGFPSLRTDIIYVRI